MAHQLDQLTHVLGDFASLSATNATLYLTGTFVDADGNATERTIQSEVTDHHSITGFLKSGVLVNIFWRGGYAAGEGTGRRQYIWEIDGEEGTIRFESNGSYGAAAAAYEPELYLNGKKVELENAGGPVESVSLAWKEFIEGKEENYATIDQAVKLHELLDTIEFSAKEGRRVAFWGRFRYKMILVT